jgi:hypothetical protein
MPHQHIAAIRLGTDPVAPLPPAAFHRTLEELLYCPKCEAAYSLVVDYDWAVTRYFPDESRRYVALLKRTIARGHASGHLVTHMETNGVAVTLHAAPDAQHIVEPLSKLRPITPHIN